MFLKNIIDVDFVNYKKPAMILGFPKCSFKCDKECGQQVCQNSALATAPDVYISNKGIIFRYLMNHLTHAICFQGLEPLDSWYDIIGLIDRFRECSQDDIVIYTGYTEKEAQWYISQLSKYPNIIMKFGRYIPDQQPHYDEVLGVNLASDNQYAKKIS